MGLFDCFARGGFPSLQEEELSVLLVGSLSLPFINYNNHSSSSDKDEKLICLQDVLPLLRELFPSHQEFWWESNKRMKQFLSCERKRKPKKTMTFLLTRRNDHKNKPQKTVFYPLSMLLPLFDVSIMDVREVQALHQLLMGNLNAKIASSNDDKNNANEVAKLQQEKGVIAVKEGDKKGPLQENLPGGDVRNNTISVDTKVAVADDIRTFSPALTPGSGNTTSQSVKKPKNKKRKLKHVVNGKLQEIEKNCARINERFDMLIAENKTILSKQTSKENENDMKLETIEDDDDGIAKQRNELLEREKKRREKKAKMKALMETGDKFVFAKPRWRHKLEGNNSPPAELILKGKQLFRMTAIIVLKLYVKPMLVVRQRRLEQKASRIEEFSRAMNLFFGLCGDWMCGIVSLPLLSILQDDTLHFNHHEAFHKQSKGLLQLKVRVSAIVNSIEKVKTFPQNILAFLRELITDGQHFPPGFLFDFEESKMKFDSAGASLDIARQVESSYLDSFTTNHTVKVNDYYYDIRVAKMLIKHVLLVRILTNAIILSPWHHGIGKPPLTGKKRITSNLRIVASVVYMLLQRHDEVLPAVKDRAEGVIGSMMATFKHVSANNSSKVIPFTVEPLEGKSAKKKTDKKIDGHEEGVVGSLLMTRKTYPSDIREMFVYLHGDDFFSAVRAEMEPWLASLSNRLNKWVTKVSKELAMEIIEERQELYRDIGAVEQQSMQSIQLADPTIRSSMPLTSPEVKIPLISPSIAGPVSISPKGLQPPSMFPTVPLLVPSSGEHSSGADQGQGHSDKSVSQSAEGVTPSIGIKNVSLSSSQSEGTDKRVSQSSSGLDKNEGQSSSSSSGLDKNEGQSSSSSSGLEKNEGQSSSSSSGLDKNEGQSSSSSSGLEKNEGQSSSSSSSGLKKNEGQSSSGLEKNEGQSSSSSSGLKKNEGQSSSGLKKNEGQSSSSSSSSGLKKNEGQSSSSSSGLKKNEGQSSSSSSGLEKNEGQSSSSSSSSGPDKNEGQSGGKDEKSVSSSSGNDKSDEKTSLPNNSDDVVERNDEQGRKESPLIETPPGDVSASSSGQKLLGVETNQVVNEEKQAAPEAGSKTTSNDVPPPPQQQVE